MTLTDLPLQDLPVPLRTRVSQILLQAKNSYALCYSWESDSRSGHLVRLAGVPLRYSILTESGSDKVHLIPETSRMARAVSLFLDQSPGIL